MCCELFLILLLAHLLGDFYCQTDKLCEEKRKKKLKSWGLYIHAIIIGVISWIFVWDASFTVFAISIAVTHFIVDAVKNYLKDSLLIFIVDQCLHIAILFAVCCMWDGAKYWEIPECGYWSTRNMIVCLAGVLILDKPSNILIKKTLVQYKINESGEESNRVGSLIGSIERLLTFLFITIGEMNAVGFLLAAKSILRFRDSDTIKTEYVLAGTLLSFGIAIMVGMLATRLLKA